MKPEIGQAVMVRGQLAIIIAVYEFGTMDVEMPSGQCYRVSGLEWI